MTNHERLLYLASKGYVRTTAFDSEPFWFHPRFNTIDKDLNHSRTAIYENPIEFRLMG